MPISTQKTSPPAQAAEQSSLERSPIESATFKVANYHSGRGLGLAIDTLQRLTRHEKLIVISEVSAIDLNIADAVARETKLNSAEVIKIVSSATFRNAYPNLVLHLAHYLKEHIHEYAPATAKVAHAFINGEDLLVAENSSARASHLNTALASFQGSFRGSQHKIKLSKLEVATDQNPESYAKIAHFLKRLSSLIDGEYYQKTVLNLIEAKTGTSIPSSNAGTISAKELDQLLATHQLEADINLRQAIELNARRKKDSMVYSIQRDLAIKQLTKDLTELAANSGIVDAVLGYDQNKRLGIYPKDSAAEVLIELPQNNLACLNLWNMTSTAVSVILPKLRGRTTNDISLEARRPCKVDYRGSLLIRLPEPEKCVYRIDLDYVKNLPKGEHYKALDKLQLPSAGFMAAGIKVPTSTSYGQALYPYMDSSQQTVEIASIKEDLQSNIIFTTQEFDLDGSKFGDTVSCDENYLLTQDSSKEPLQPTFRVLQPNAAGEFDIVEPEKKHAIPYLSRDNLTDEIISNSNSDRFIITHEIFPDTATTSNQSRLHIITTNGSTYREIQDRQVTTRKVVTPCGSLVSLQERCSGQHLVLTRCLQIIDPKHLEIDHLLELGSSSFRGVATTENNTYLGLSQNPSRAKSLNKLVLNGAAPPRLERVGIFPDGMDHLHDAFTWQGKDYFILSGSKPDKMRLYDQDLRAVSPRYKTLTLINSDQLMFLAQTPSGIEILHPNKYEPRNWIQRKYSSPLEIAPILAEALLTGSAERIHIAASLIEHYSGCNLKPQVTHSQLQLLDLLRQDLRKNNQDLEIRNSSPNNFDYEEVCSLITSSELLFSLCKDKKNSGWSNALAKAGNFFRDTFFLDKSEPVMNGFSPSECNAKGGNPRGLTQSKNQASIATFSRSLKGFVYRSVHLTYNSDNHSWIRSCPASDLSSDTNYTSVKVSLKSDPDCPVVTLPIPGNSRLTSSVAQGPTASKSINLAQLGGQDWVPDVHNDAGASEINYEIAMYAPQKIDTRVSSLSYRLQIQQNPDYRTATIPLGPLPAEQQAFCDSIRDLPPYERLIKTRAHIKSIGFYDMDNGLVSAAKVNRPISEKVSVMQARMEIINNQNNQRYSNKKLAMVCADAAELGVALLREVGLAAGYAEGYVANGKVLKAHTAHAIAVVAWPSIETGKMTLMEVDFTPSTSSLEGLQYLAQLFGRSEKPEQDLEALDFKIQDLDQTNLEQSELGLPTFFEANINATSVLEQYISKRDQALIIAVMTHVLFAPRNPLDAELMLDQKLIEKEIQDPEAFLAAQPCNLDSASSTLEYFEQKNLPKELRRAAEIYLIRHSGLSDHAKDYLKVSWKLDK